MPTFITDIDHTLARSERRIHLKGDWDRFHADAINDEPIADTIALIRSLKKAGWRIVVFTGRPEKWRHVTMGWLVTNNVPVDVLMMRPNDNYDTSPKVKIDALKRLNQKNRSNILLMDDRADVIEAFREVGITTLQVSVGKREDATPRQTNSR